MENATDKKKWYFNTKTKKVEHGRISSLFDIIGPYNTEEEAANALNDVATRNDEWTLATEEWDEHTEVEDGNDYELYTTENKKKREETRTQQQLEEPDDPIPSALF